MADAWCAIRGGRERLGSSAAQETDMGRYSLPRLECTLRRRDIIIALGAPQKAALTGHSVFYIR